MTYRFQCLHVFNSKYFETEYLKIFQLEMFSFSIFRIADSYIFFDSLLSSMFDKDLNFNNAKFEASVLKQRSRIAETAECKWLD